MYKRVLLKLSGEALKGNSQHHILDVSCLKQFATVIALLHEKGIEIAIVIGAGNIWRGKLAKEIGINPVSADYMGMMGTVINAAALSSSLKENCGVDSVVFSAIPEVESVSVPYEKDAVNKALDEGKVVFLAGGTGKPFYTTDTAAALRALELNCDAILVGKHGVEGVYDKDPRENPDAKFIKTLTFEEMLEKHLQIMDLSAIELIKNSNIDVRIFSMKEPENFLKVVQGSDIGTTMKRGK